MDWLDEAEIAVENQGNRFYLQVDGNDIVSITDIDREAGTALVTVHASTHPDANTAWTGVVNLKERGDPANHHEENAMSKMAKAAQANNPLCPKAHPLTIEDSDGFLFGRCDECGETWRVMFDGKVIPKGHPLG